MNTIERAARALVEWELGMTGDVDADVERYGSALSERQSRVDQNWPGKVKQAEHLLRAIGQPASSTSTALSHLRRFRDTFNAGEPVEEESGLTADDLTSIITAVEAFGEDVVARDPE